MRFLWPFRFLPERRGKNTKIFVCLEKMETKLIVNLSSMKDSSQKFRQGISVKMLEKRTKNTKKLLEKRTKCCYFALEKRINYA